MKNLTVVGVGHVGLVTGACFADLGNRVIALDTDQARVEGLQRGQMPIYEPGLEELVSRNVSAGRLTFTSSYDEAIRDAEFVFISVGTPGGVEGEADMKYVRQAAESIAEAMIAPLIIVNKSTVPVGTGDWVADIIQSHQKVSIPFSVVSNPEFLREGAAISDFMSPARTVLGSTDARAAEKVAQLHLPLRAPIVITDLRTAEMIKYASNAFLATKISFINEIANICEALGADIKEVATGMGYDPRITRSFLDAGLGYGGSCFPKDVKALAYMAEEKGRHPQLLHAVMEINQDRRSQLVEKARELMGGLEGKKVGLLGLTFKPNTDDLREAPALDVAELLLQEGAQVVAYDPVGMEGATHLMPDIEMAGDAYALADQADAIIVCTEWNEFIQLDLERIRDLMREPVIIDGRNIYDPKEVVRLGFKYVGFGQGYGADESAAAQTERSREGQPSL
ncbi:MAG: UDP-glucose/GDP-mannose dehydrogenase family protein [Chloroflexi bacterium]|nr:UDP-glucose/GDP-mannose dehydrogenase family protein [Chloroflexota bacterium]MDK1044126.1 UDP-glucose/GDP-mannose dehydrogenase family protein [Anaerolineales bacterium]MCH8877222.1 UDP-glucose/GDP-mannose dehydrogenase family protein [Chloroflexota bacterium]MCI0773251.1 UDP-glucose/GDP-mannose dehydrogenase family protein [Chloroflexota bacterium]MCI0806727.1 UDP-glucose/GDP-mannose dehydrogenase family protein [Chloroflexota bacterium]